MGAIVLKSFCKGNWIGIDQGHGMLVGLAVHQDGHQLGSGPCVGQAPHSAGTYVWVVHAGTQKILRRCRTHEEAHAFCAAVEGRLRAKEDPKASVPVGKPITDAYYIRIGAGFREVTGKPVQIGGFEYLDLFIHRPWLSRKGWVISEGRTGQTVTKERATQKAAIETAQGIVRGYGREKLEWAIALELEMAVSPRYRATGSAV